MIINTKSAILGWCQFVKASGRVVFFSKSREQFRCSKDTQNIRGIEFFFVTIRAVPMVVGARGKKITALFTPNSNIRENDYSN